MGARHTAGASHRGGKKTKFQKTVDVVTRGIGRRGPLLRRLRRLLNVFLAGWLADWLVGRMCL